MTLDCGYGAASARHRSGTRRAAAPTIASWLHVRLCHIWRTCTMFTHLTDSAKAFVFYGTAFGLTLTVSLLAPFIGDATPAVHMLTPFLAVLLMLLVVTRDGYSRTGWGSL